MTLVLLLVALGAFASFAQITSPRVMLGAGPVKRSNFEFALAGKVVPALAGTLWLLTPQDLYKSGLSTATTQSLLPTYLMTTLRTSPSSSHWLITLSLCCMSKP